MKKTVWKNFFNGLMLFNAIAITSERMIEHGTVIIVRINVFGNAVFITNSNIEPAPPPRLPHGVKTDA
jgi:hypothetical protein